MNRYIYLSTHSNFTPKETVVTPAEIVDFAVKDGACAVALTDYNSVNGLSAFSKAAEKYKDKGFKPIYGVQIYGMDSERDSEPRIITILAKNQTGLHKMYQIISLGYQKKLSEKVWPCVSYKDIQTNHDGIFVGITCTKEDICRTWTDDEEVCDSEKLKGIIQSEYAIADYVEIRPWRFYADDSGTSVDETAPNAARIQQRMFEIVKGIKTERKMVVAANGSNCMTEQDVRCLEILRDGYSDTDAAISRFLTTEEMLDEYCFMGQETTQEIVLDNPNAIAEMIGDVVICDNKRHPFNIEGAEEKLRTACKEALLEKYGDSFPDLISERYTSELDNILSHGYASYYVLAAMLVKKSKALGYLHNTRGCVGGSLIAYLLGITETNPLPPHYYCPSCKRVSFVEEKAYPSGFDLNCYGAEVRVCSHCGEPLTGDGHNIPVEFFAGIDGEKVPDIDINVASEIHEKMLDYLGEIVGKDKIFYAGTTNTISLRTADLLIEYYCENHSIHLSTAETAVIRERLSGVYRSEGRHPGGIVIVPETDDIFDYTSVRHQDPSEAQFNRIPTASVDYHGMLSGLTKLDILSNSMFTKLKQMEEMTGISARGVQFSEINIADFFSNDSLLGLPLGITYNGFFVQRFSDFSDAVAPVRYSDLVKNYSFAHGTNVWTENAEILATAGVPLKDLIAAREDVMLTLLRHGIDRKTAFKLAEMVRIGKAGKCLTAIQESLLTAHGIPDWYIASMKRVSYLFPKAHATEYVTNYLRMIWYKIYHPTAFYAAILNSNETAIDCNVLVKGKIRIKQEQYRVQMELDRIQRKMETDFVFDDLDSEENLLRQHEILSIALECCERGIVFLPADINKPNLSLFIPEYGAIRIPFNPPKE